MPIDKPSKIKVGKAVPSPKPAADDENPAAVKPAAAKATPAKAPTAKAPAVKAPATAPAVKAAAVKAPAVKAAAVKAPAVKAAAAKAPARQAKASTPVPVSAEERQRMIDEASYYLAERRGFAGGDPVEDWVAAEAEIDRILSAGPGQA